MRIEPVSPGNDRATAEFLTGWVTDGPADAWENLASHTGGEGASLVTVRAGRVIGIVSVQWESNYAGFRDRGIPLVHQVSVARPARSQGVATQLLTAAEQRARDPAFVAAHWHELAG